MNVQEMHIEVNMSSQKIRSNYYRKFKDSEVDWLLNKHTDRFIRDRIKQDTDSLGFDSTEVDMDALRTLEVLDRELATLMIEDYATHAEVPGNYAYMIDDFSFTIDQCYKALYRAATALQAAPGLDLTMPSLSSHPAAPSPTTQYYEPDA